MPARTALRSPDRLPLLFIAVALAPALALAWLGWRLLEQDRALEGERIQVRLESAADLVCAQLKREQTELEEQLAIIAGSPSDPASSGLSELVSRLGDAAVLVVFEPGKVASHSGGRLLYHPETQSSNESPPAVFVRGEQQELRFRNYAAAEMVYRRLAASKDPSIRAGALLRLARTMRKSGEFDEALATYAELTKLGDTPVESLPAELAARFSICGLMEERSRRDQLLQEANLLYQGLHQGRWRLSRAEFSFYEQRVRKWLDRSAIGGARLAVSAGVEAVWDQWERLRTGEGATAARRSLWLHNEPILVLWRSSPQRLAALLASQREVENFTRATLEGALKQHHVRTALTDSEGHLVIGRLPASDVRQVVRTTAKTQLPWTLHLESADPASDLAGLAWRRRVLLAGISMMAMVLLVGIYFISRAVRKEIQVAEMKSDFVSAVSHEFRTPLTTMRQFTEMLSKGRIPTEQRRHYYYEVLAKETSRLQRLVEGLLNFARIEAGATEYQLVPLDGAKVVRDVVDAFREEAGEPGCEIRLSDGAQEFLVRADREALFRALWNLLDNAVKYSPDCRTVWVEVESNGKHLAVRVRDQGLGIGRKERDRIFRKFARGDAAQSSGVKGTGIGLATVEHIVRGHGGRIRVESELGRGSTFSIVLPLME